MNEDKVIELLLDNTDRLERMENSITGMVTKSDITELTNTIDKLATSVKRMEEDHAADIGWLRRHDKAIEEHSQDIKKIKTNLKIA